MLAQAILFRTQQTRTLTLQDFMDLIVIFEQQENREPSTEKSHLSKLDYRIGEHDEEGM